MHLFCQLLREGHSGLCPRSKLVCSCQCLLHELWSHIIRCTRLGKMSVPNESNLLSLRNIPLCTDVYFSLTLLGKLGFYEWHVPGRSFSTVYFSCLGLCGDSLCLVSFRLPALVFLATRLQSHQSERENYNVRNRLISRKWMRNKRQKSKIWRYPYVNTSITTPPSSVLWVVPSQ